MNEILLTITQALQLVALAPSIFVIAFLLFSSRRNGDNVVPILYFLTLSCSFILPLLPIFGAAGNQLAQGALMVGESLTVAFSFLLIIQFLRGSIPPLLYWMILAIPLVGGSPFIYISMLTDEVCLSATNSCLMTGDLFVLYKIISSALIFLLLVFQFARSTARIAVDDVDRAHKYWLIIALIVLSLFILLVDLLVLSEQVAPADAQFIVTVIRIGFIYLVLTSIFRLFYDLFDIRLLESSNDKQRAVRDPEQDKKLVKDIRELMEGRHLYREMGLTREGLAKKLNITEHTVSRIVNTYFGKNFNEMVNDYRIREAKDRLLQEDTQITVIAFEVGFSSIASFNRVFKELAGSSPTAFRAFHANSVR